MLVIIQRILLAVMVGIFVGAIDKVIRGGYVAPWYYFWSTAFSMVICFAAVLIEYQNGLNRTSKL